MSDPLSPAPAPGTPGWLRSRNDSQALVLLLDRGPLTRADIGRLTGLSKPTAAQMVRRLEAFGLVGPVGAQPARRGPQAVTYGVRVDRLRALAMDVRDTTIAAVVVDADGRAREVVTLPVGDDGRSAEADVTAALTAACEAAGVAPDGVGIVVVGVQAAVGDTGDRLSLTDTLPGWPATGARSRLEHRLGRQVVVENDVKLAAVAERADGHGGDAHDFALVWLGNGVGVAVDVAGALHRGASGTAGEIGYLSVPREAAAIDPDADDLTELLGRRAVDRLRDKFGSGDLAALLAGPHRKEVLADLAARIALGVAPVVAVLDPELVVLGGPTGAAGGAALARAVADRIADESRWRVRVVAAGVTDQPVLAGARHLAVGLLRERLLDLVAVTAATTIADPSIRHEGIAP